MVKSKKRNYVEDIRILRQALINKKLVVFVGAGVSCASGLPSWNEAITEIKTKLYPESTSVEVDKLKIPQYYFDSRGKKEYTDLIKSIFKSDEKLTPNENHYKIISLNTHTIITTNYDDLLSEAAAEKQQVIQVICQNKDLPSKTIEREIIKMHGDFVHDNFVLKESDYIHYSSDFSLIETYIKSLIATNVVLFLGYSFSDPDVKQLFSWVKDILKDDFQRAYLFDVSSDYDSYECEYFKNIGINLLYANNFNFPSSYNKSKKLSAFLDLLNATDKGENLIDELYQYCLPYRDIRYIRMSDAKRILQVYNSFIQSDNLHLFCGHSYKELSRVLSLKNNVRIKFVFSVFEKSIIKHIIIRETADKLQKISLSSDVIDSLLNSCLYKSVFDFDFEELRKIQALNELELSDIRPDLYLQQAYISYHLSDYIKSYNYLKKCSKLFYDSKQYTWYFISEFNRYNLSQLIMQNMDVSDEIRAKFRNEFDLIDMNAIYDAIPNLSSVPKSLLQDIYTYRMYYYAFQDLYLIGKKTEEEANTQYIFNTEPSYTIMRNKVKDCFLFEQLNYILFDQYTENIETYRLFAKVILNSSLCSDIVSKDSVFGIIEASNVHVRELESYDLTILLRYLRIDELQSILDNNDKKLLRLSENASSHLQTVCNNLSFYDKNNEYYWKLICLMQSISVNDKIAYMSLNSIISRINNTLQIERIKYIKKLLLSYERQGLFNNDRCLKELSVIVDSLFALKIDSTFRQNVYFDNLLEVALNICKRVGMNCFSNNALKVAKTNDFLFLSNVYPYMDDKVKAQIDKSLKKWKFDNQISDVDIYTRMVLSEIREPDRSIESAIVELYSNTLTPNGVTSYPDTRINILNNLLSLYLNYKIIDEKPVINILHNANDERTSWLSQIEDFDYSKFNPEWLINCTAPLLKYIASNPSVNHKISNIIKKEFLSGQLSNKKVLDIYFQYFVDYSDEE